MAKKISDWIIMSDIDGTLVMEGDIIPRRNLEALRRFTGKGGKFALATGRTFINSRSLLEQLPVNFPCVLFNGGILYDFTDDRILLEHQLPKQGLDYLAEMLPRFSDGEVMVVNRDNYFEVAQKPGVTKGETPHETYKDYLDSVDKARELGICKCLFVLPDNRIADLIAYVASKEFPGVRFVRTGSNMMEMLPLGVSKGQGLQQLMNLMGFSKDKLVVIGDYYNDLEMLGLAGLGVVAGNAPDDVKSAANLVVCSNREGALADLVEYLESISES